MLLLLTDGIPETESPDGQQFGMQRATQLVYQHRKSPANEILESRHQALRKFSGEASPTDDITAVLVKVV